MGRAVVVLGAGLLCVHAFFMVRAWRFQTTALLARGTVVGFQVLEDHSRGTGTSARRRYYAQVEFQTAQGETHRFSSGDGHSAPFYRTGEVLDVLYPANDPSRAEIRSFSAIWGGPIAPGLLGVAFIMGGIWEWRHGRRGPTVGTVVRLKG